MATTAMLPVACDSKELSARRYALESTLGTTLAEGVSPTPEAMAIFERYASGELSLDEMSGAVKALYGI